MREHTFIAIFRDADGQYVDFERFGYKRVSTVVKAVNKLWESPLYRVCTKGAETVDIYDTDEWRQAEPVATVQLVA